VLERFTAALFIAAVTTALIHDRLVAPVLRLLWGGELIAQTRHEVGEQTRDLHLGDTDRLAYPCAPQVIR
jgi:hypothetical protein